MLTQRPNFLLRVMIPVIFLLTLGLSFECTAADQKVDDEQLRSLIKEVIRENPKLIVDTVNQYLAEQKKAQEKLQFEASLKNRLNDVISKNTPQKGPSDAPVTIIEYTDFQCPYCARGTKTVSDLMKMYPNQIRVVFKNFPLKMHQQAVPAAKAALAAAEQGKFWEYHDLLFENSKTLDAAIYGKLAADLSLDIEKFKKDMDSEAIAEHIKTDQAQAKKHGFTSAPRFLVNGVHVKGAKPTAYFKQVIDRLLSESNTN